MIKFLAVLIFLAFSISTHAYESDQFTLPNVELADVGSDISTFVYHQTSIAIEKINDDIKELPLKIEKTKEALNSPDALEKPLLIRALKLQLKAYTDRYNEIQTQAGITKSIYKEIGGHFSWQDQRDGVFGLPLSIIPYPENIKDGKLITYIPKKTKNIYAFSGFHRILSSSYFVFCSSLKMYGVYLGVDKLGHMFNQGYEYFEHYNKALTIGDNQSALKTIVDWGVKTENGIYGLIVDGVYSNGDLAANFSGFHFYKNLLEPINMGLVDLPSILVINSDKTVSFNTQREINPNGLLKPFISAHLNEALNPSYFEGMQRPILKKVIKNRCEKVLSFYEIQNHDEIKNLSDSLMRWHGLDYGNRSDNILRIDDLCF